ncbi:putative U6 snRNA-associated Sm-like protein LSm2 [Giardia duodenalis]|uniref:U6 snRNA-associated Sm-like protein LSm2 n=2 Tax=Giardia intestinalis TaxID=5741 RepID=A8BT30_GIAIC|nr:putative U6 snRNA-associated Sm-like protein LSm2 [Giardia intestinalis]ESU35685.1 LSM family protein [Giardia intestinalis]KAE8305920.1 putative U6 snRNA-associated Sm-like protein LSm2 [Giardia intestinalis]|eukprot:XP_001705015.1 U6 snRNA-associated Sm-like protein LSm2, putative [Giardia lamblia ATCC 50803]
MLYLTFLSKLVGRKVYVELKSGMQMHGVLLASDNFANLSLDNPVIYGSDISFTHVSGGRRVFIRGSAIQFLYLNDVEGDESLSLRALADDSRINWAKEHHSQENLAT